MRKEFEVHMLNETGKGKARSIATAFSDLLEKVEATCMGASGGRELALVRTKLEEACFFAKKAMAGNVENQVVDVAKTVATVLLGLLLLFALAPAIALAQAAAPAAPAPIGQQLLGLIGSSGGIATIVTLVGGVLAMAFGSNVVLKRRIALAAYHAFHVTEDIANEDTSENGIDKAAVALKQIDAYFAANGWRAMKPGDVELAKLQLQSLSGQEVQAKKLAAIAGEAAAHPQTPPAS